MIDKPAGLGSTAVVARVRRAYDARKAGHAGTLDPAATGVLPVALGEATKTIPVVGEGLKIYRFRVRFGAETETDDAEGAILSTADGRPSDRDLAGALAAFRGDIMQVPPRVSAVRVDGARAYDLARAGDAPSLRARPLHVARLELLSRDDADHATLAMTCGQGGYVRAIARDLGRALGCLAHVATLRRTATGPFTEADACPLAAVEADPNALRRPLEAGLAEIPRMICDATAAARLANGNPAAVAGSDLVSGGRAWAAHDGRAVALGVVRDGTLHPARVFLR